MNPEDSTQKTLEVIISEKVFSRLKTQMLLVYVISFAVATGIALSLTWEYKALSALASTRISEYQLLVADRLHELHHLDLNEVKMRTKPDMACPDPLPANYAEVTLAREFGRLPERAEVRQLLEKANDFGVCDIGEVEHILKDGETMAKIDTVYRILLGRPADPVGRFIYGYWLTNGIDIEVVARDVMTSPEFARLRQLSNEP